MRSEARLKVGVVGAGYISEFHLRALAKLPGVTVVGIADRDAARARKMADRFHIPRACSSFEELATEPLDVVHVLTPPDSHREVALAALKRGCHVLVEKPFVASVEHCDELSAAAKSTGKRICVVHSYLRDPFLRRALRAVQRGAIGEILTVDYFRSSMYPPYAGGPLPVQYRNGGYPFRDMGVHALYIMEAFLGPIRDARAWTWTFGEDPLLYRDEWRALVECERGTGQIQLSWNVKPIQDTLFIQGTKGTIRADMMCMFVTQRRKTRLPTAAARVLGPLREALQTAVQVHWNVFRFVLGRIRRYEGLQSLIEEFYDCLAAGRQVPFPPECARPIVQWTETLARRGDEDKRALLARLPDRLMARALVTGGTGFIGGHLLRELLKRGDRVRLFARRMPPDPIAGDPRVEVVLGDLGDPEAVDRALQGIEVVFHLGAATHGWAEDFQRGTVVGTQNVVESMLRHRVRKLVYISSLSVLHMTAVRRGQRITESFPLEPHPERRGHYTQTKLQAERIVLDAVRDRGLRAVLLRPGQVFGPGAPLITGAVARRRGKRLLFIGSGKVPLPLVYVGDVVDAILKAGESDAFDGSVFHLVDPVSLDQNELVRRFREATTEGWKTTHVPVLAIYALSLPIGLMLKILGKASPISIYRVRSSRPPISFDCSAAKQRLGWAPAIGTEEGLRRTLADPEPPE